MIWAPKSAGYAIFKGCKLTDRFDAWDIVLHDSGFMVLLWVVDCKIFPVFGISHDFSDCINRIGAPWFPRLEGRLGRMRQPVKGYRIIPDNPSWRIFVEQDPMGNIRWSETIAGKTMYLRRLLGVVKVDMVFIWL
jgi:hypothetical protein